MVLRDGRPVPNGTGHLPGRPTPEVVCMRMESRSWLGRGFHRRDGYRFATPDMTWISCRNNKQHNAGAENCRGGKLARCGRVPVRFRPNLGMAMDICAWTMSSGEFFAPTGRGPVRSFPFPPAGVRRSDRRKRSSGWLAFSGFLLDFARDGTCLLWRQRTLADDE